MLTYAQIAISGLLVISILLQQRGGGLSSTFGGSSMEYSTKRGAEKVIFYATIVLAISFLGLSMARLLL
ncbi:MAG: preprotein translocase subunit SecG [Candidatus Yanofskybacteria bacterium RIFCSPHIGHO2_02_FULL_39_10]|uniref:Protein-export membrane protein SecG n=1 Tax=Candidatus Yanofskybacteria bacterium RIFCSPHIGHO2_02_FULL_39_10 TaxID=1802674 RepID=A0A1F8F4U7_9BACT|nr:MAG: preprotein translocase subunit SecG [Candidatus Yanofskybacteria bacterium RIFCSPHIGHO2_02_FULL_39_10]